MTDNRGFVIIGASLAGAKAAQTLREEGFDGRIALIGEESFEGLVVYVPPMQG